MYWYRVRLMFSPPTHFFVGPAIKQHIFRLLLVTVLVSSVGPLSNRSVDAASTLHLEQAINELAEEIAESMAEARETKIAVVDLLDSSKRDIVLCKYISESITSELLGNPGIEMYERALLNEVMSEHRLLPSGVIDKSTAIEIGRLTGVDAVVTGTITEMSRNVGINLRLISARSGEVFAAARRVVEKDEDVLYMLRENPHDGKDRVDERGVNAQDTRTEGISSEESIQQPMENNIEARVEEFEYELEGCNKEVKESPFPGAFGIKPTVSVFCKVRVKSTFQRAMKVYIQDAYVLDNSSGARLSMRRGSAEVYSLSPRGEVTIPLHFSRSDYRNPQINDVYLFIKCSNGEGYVATKYFDKVRL